MPKDYLKKTFGDAYTDEIDTAFGKVLGEKFIPKTVHAESLEKIKTLEESITERDKQLEDLKKASEGQKNADGDSDALKEQIEQMQTANKAAMEKMQADYEGKISDMQFGTMLEGHITASGAKNAKAIKALLELDNLKASKNQEQDIKEAIEKVKTENDYLGSPPRLWGVRSG